jgi:hypothetical protein
MWAVIPTRDRRDLLEAQLVRLLDAGIEPVVVDTGENLWLADLPVVWLPVPTPPLNISRWWNIGLQAADVNEAGPYEVAVLNDDVAIGGDTLLRIAEVMREQACAAAFPDVHHALPAGQVRVKTHAAPSNLFHRMTGFCFVLAGELGLRADENLHWWYGDDDLEWQAADQGGVVCVGGTSVAHLDPNGWARTNPELHVQAGQDRLAFEAKWGRAPW